MVEDTSAVRLRRVEQDIETLRTTQNAVLDRFDSINRTLQETRDLAAENRERLERVEGRLERVEGRLELLEEVVLENRAIMLENRTMMRENRTMMRENRAIIRENRSLLLMIADHLDLTLEKPDLGSQPD